MKIARILLVLLVCWWICLGVGTIMSNVGLWFINNVILVYRIQTVICWMVVVVGGMVWITTVWFIWWLGQPGERCTWFDHRPE